MKDFLCDAPLIPAVLLFASFGHTNNFWLIIGLWVVFWLALGIRDALKEIAS